MFLLQSYGILPEGAALFWTLAFAISGGIFLYVFTLNRDNWWALVPAAALLGVAGVIALGTFLPAAADPWSGALFMAVLSLGFWGIWPSNARCLVGDHSRRHDAVSLGDDRRR